MADSAMLANLIGRLERHMLDAAQYNEGLIFDLMPDEQPVVLAALSSAHTPPPSMREDEVERLRRDCSELYQVIGTMAEHCPNPTDPAIVKALDNASAASAGKPRRHDDLLPFILPEPATPAPAQAPEGWQEVQHLISAARAFLNCFNPATELAGLQEQQWWSVYDQCERVERLSPAPPMTEEEAAMQICVARGKTAPCFKPCWKCRDGAKNVLALLRKHTRAMDDKQRGDGK